MAKGKNLPVIQATVHAIAATKASSDEQLAAGQGLRGAIEAENADMAQQGGGSRFTVQPLPRPGLGCVARFLLHHNYANGVNISGTEVALVFGGQVVAKHLRFDYELEGDSVSGSAGAHNWRDLLAKIVRQDVDWIARRRGR